MKRIIVLLAFLAAVTGCASSAAARPAASPHTTAPAEPVSVRVVLPSRTMAAGSQMAGRVVVDNNTGHAIYAYTCRGLFDVTLSNSTYHPQGIAPAVACSRTPAIPVGKSSYRVTVVASWWGCNTSGAPACLPGKQNPQIPPLPPGTYQATLGQLGGQHVPAPPAITVRVTAK